MTDDEKKIKLVNLINSLAQDEILDNDMDKYIKELNEIYSDEYRHEYSEITNVLFSIESVEEKGALIEKIKVLYEKVKDDDKFNKNFKKSMGKLYDHVNLENIRMMKLTQIADKANSVEEIAATINDELTRSKSDINSLNNKIIEYNKQSSKFNKSIRKAQHKMEQIQKHIKNSTTESITILSIFAGIVMAFSGGISFIANAISGINKIGPYRLSVFILLVGCVMFNVIFLLLYMIMQ